MKTSIFKNLSQRESNCEISYVLNNYSEFDNLRNEAFEFTKKNYTTTAWYDKFIRGKY